MLSIFFNGYGYDSSMDHWFVNESRLVNMLMIVDMDLRPGKETDAEHIIVSGSWLLVIQNGY